MKILFGLFILAALAAGETKLGKPMALKQATPIATLASNPGPYLGKIVQVRGKVTEVCQMMGCWMNLVDEGGKMVRIKVEDGAIVFPKEAIGKIAVAEGKFTKIELSKEQATARLKHEAEESGRKFDPASVKGATTIYQVQGTGAMILE